MEHISFIFRAEGGSISLNMAVSMYQTGDPEDDKIKTLSELHVSYQKKNIQTARGNAVTSPNSMCRNPSQFSCPGTRSVQPAALRRRTRLAYLNHNWTT